MHPSLEYALIWCVAAGAVLLLVGVVISGLASLLTLQRYLRV